MVYSRKLPQTLQEEFNYLRFNQGADRDRMEHCPNIMALLGETDPSAALARLKNEVEKETIRDWRALSNALAFTVAERHEKSAHRSRWNLSTRRIDFGYADRTGGASEEAVKNWEDAAIAALVRRFGGTLDPPDSNVVPINKRSASPTLPQQPAAATHQIPWGDMRSREELTSAGPPPKALFAETIIPPLTPDVPRSSITIDAKVVDNRAVDVQVHRGRGPYKNNPSLPRRSVSVPMILWRQDPAHVVRHLRMRIRFDEGPPTVYTFATKNLLSITSGHCDMKAYEFDQTEEFERAPGRKLIGIDTPLVSLTCQIDVPKPDPDLYYGALWVYSKQT